MYYSLESFIRQNDTDGIVKDAVKECIIRNLDKDISIDILADSIVNKIEGYLFDDGSNVIRDLTNDIKCTLNSYFDTGKK